jgi:hypothetical protein
MYNISDLYIGFVFGLITCLFIGLTEVVGKLNKDKIKKLCKIFLED